MAAAAVAARYRQARWRRRGFRPIPTNRRRTATHLTFHLASRGTYHVGTGCRHRARLPQPDIAPAGGAGPRAGKPRPQPDTYWLGAGLGAGSEDFAGHASLAYQHGPSLFSLRLAGTAGLFDDGFGDIGLLYGRATRQAGRRYRAAAAIGLAAVDGCETPGPGALFSTCEAPSTVLGLPLEAQLAWLPAEFLGIGLYGFADFNSLRSFAGVTFSLQLGKVR
jgi:hypothetical protein